MPIEHRLDPDTGILQTTISGPVTMEELREHFAGVYAMKGQRHPELIDTRAVSGMSFGARDLPKLADLGRQLFADGYTAPRAVIVAGVMHFGMARLFATFAAPWVRIAVFDNQPAAEGWLDIIASITKV